MSDRKRLLNELRVIDLRMELEKRNLDKSGVRGVLLKRLFKHLEEEGHDPETFEFTVMTPEPKTSQKKTRLTDSTVEQDLEDTPTMEDMIVQDDAGEEDETEQQPDTTDEVVNEDKMDVEDSQKPNRKRECEEECDTTQAKKPCLEQNSKQEDESKQENNTDAEDSINLDLGEDELLNEETDNSTKNKKDDAVNEDAVEMTGDNAPTDDTPAAAAAATTTAAPVAADSASADDQHEDNAEASATSADNEKCDVEDHKDENSKETESDKKDKKDECKEGGARNLWVSGLSGDTRAKDLKQLCSKYGKVLGAKIVTNARTPGSRCYGYVTMHSTQGAENCIKNLHRTELHGRMISVEKAKSESESSRSRQTAPHSERHSSRERKDDSKEEEEVKEGDKKEETKKEEDAAVKSHRSTSRTRDKSHSHRSEKDKSKRSTRSRERRRSREVLSFSKIWKERDVARARERSRAMREEERRRRAAEDALRERERRQREEKHRLAMEREKLRAEREKIEREKNELLRLERERHRLEREKLELERLELKRAQLRLEEERRKRTYESSNAYRKAGSPPPEPYERHKRAPPPPAPSSRGQFEAPPPPRFDMTTSYDRSDKRERDREYKRDYPRHVSSGGMKYPSNGNAPDDARQPLPPGTRPKEPRSGYEPRDSRPYRTSPGGGKPERLPAWSASSRYPDAVPGPAQNKGAGGGGEQWSSGGGDARGYAYEPRYSAPYQPPPPGATAAYPDRYPQQSRQDYRKY